MTQYHSEEEAQAIAEQEVQQQADEEKAQLEAEGCMAEALAKDEAERAEAMEQMNTEMNREEPPMQSICLTCFYYNIATKKCSKGKQPDYNKKGLWRHNLCSNWTYFTNEGR